MKSSRSIITPPIKVGFDAKRYFNNTTGLGNYARWLIDGLSTLPQDNLEYLLFTPSKRESVSSNTIIEPKGIWKIVKWLWRIKGVNQDLVRKNITVYHGLSNELPFGIHRTKVKTIVTIHDLINLRYPQNYGAFDRLVYKLKLKYAQKHADLIITPSEQTKLDLLHFFKTDEKKIEVIPLSIPQIPAVQQNNETPYILCVSSFNKRKNLENLINAYLSIEGEKYPLVLAGKMGEEYTKLARLIQKTASIKLIPNPSTQQIHSLYSGAVFCIYPSIFEGFGIPILEAFSHNKVIATSNTSSLPEVGGDATLYFNPFNINEIATSIKQLSSSKARTDFELKIPKQLAKFSSDKLLNKYQNCYIKLTHK